MEESINYKDIVLNHGYGILKSRSLANTSISIGELDFNSPVCISNMPSIQNFNILKQLNDNNWFYIYHRFGDVLNFVETINEQEWRCKSISIGVKEKDYNLLLKIKQRGYKINYITIDVAFCYAEHVKEMIQYARKNFPEAYIIVGNGYTIDVVKFLSDLGVNCFKFSVGVSENCRTRQYTGFGSTSVSDLINVVDYKRRNGYNLDICADGGLTCSNGEVWVGDVMKALVLGSKFVMSGSLFKGLNELKNENGEIYCYGNASAKNKGNNEHVEGVGMKIKPFNRDISEQMNFITDCLRSSISYAGIKNLKEITNSNKQILSYKVIK